MKRDFYAVLGVARNAARPEIRARFLELARTRHPDRFQGREREQAEKEFQEITEAFNVLFDGERRRQHDIELNRPEDRPSDPRQLGKVFLSRGAKAYKQGNYLEAASNFKRATEAEPGNPKCWHHLAMACLQERRWWPQARESIEQACRLSPKDATYLKVAGKVFAETGMTARAREYYNRALRVGGASAAIRKALEELEGPRENDRRRKSGLFGKQQ